MILNIQVVKDKKTECVAKIITEKFGKKIASVLVVGCGSGVEAAVLSQCLDAEVVGIDVIDNFDPDSMTIASLQLGDAMSLEFDDCSFDFIYSYHALEHISNPSLALQEIHRVLKDGGGCWIGTPNRSRAIGYLGSKGVTLSNKLKWNLADWKARVTGQFTNEKGAHAGFSSAELRCLLESQFSSVHELSDVYFSTVYEGHKLSLNILRLSKLSKIAYPSVYFIGHK
jgi:ubiquinone/menaquinone biosynthesis C-methylase UbiE